MSEPLFLVDITKILLVIFQKTTIYFRVNFSFLGTGWDVKSKSAL